jgi:phosphoesterase RecJ-like protein
VSEVGPVTRMPPAPTGGDGGTPVPSEVQSVFRRTPGRAFMLGHVHPDADALGTLLALGTALERIGWTVEYGGPHPVPASLGFLPGADRYVAVTEVSGQFDLVVMTDCPDPGRTAGVLDLVRPRSRLLVNIDHHPDNRRYGDTNWVEPTAAAVGEMMFDLLRALGLPIDRDIATNLFTAVHMDTGSFRYSNVTPRTFRIAAELVAAGAEPASVTGHLYERRQPESLHQLGRVLSLVQVSGDGRIGWLALPAGAVPESFVEAEDLVNYPRSIATTKVGALLRELDEGVKVSLRAKGEVDVRAIAARFGGGGHRNAAGCVVPGPLESATARVLDAVREALDR